MKKFLMILTTIGLVMTTTSVVACGSSIKQVVDTIDIVKNDVDLTLSSTHQSATLTITQSEALSLKLIQSLDSQVYVKNDDNWVDSLSVNNNAIVLSATFVLNQSNGEVTVMIFADNPMQSAVDVVFTFKNKRTLTIQDLYLDYYPEVEIVKAANIDDNHEFATLTLVRSEALSLKLLQVDDHGLVSYGDNWIDHFEWVVGVNQTLINATLKLKTRTGQVEIIFNTNKAMRHSENLMLTLDKTQKSKSTLIVTGLNLNFIRTDPVTLQKYPTLKTDHQSATFDLTFSEALSLKLTQFDSNGIISQGINWPRDHQLTTALKNGTEIIADLLWQENGSVKITLTSSQKMSVPSNLVFEVNKDDEPLARLLVGDLNLDYDGEIIIDKVSTDVKISADKQSAILTLSAAEAKSLKITPTSNFLTTYLSETSPQVMTEVSPSSFNDDGSIGLILTLLEVMNKPTTVVFDFGYPSYSSKQLIIKDLYLDLASEVIHQGDELTIDRSNTEPMAKLTLTALEARSLGLSKQDFFEHWSTTLPTIKASLDFNDLSFDFTFIFGAPEPINTPIDVSFNFAKPGKTPKILTIKNFILP
ncbi:hypothetical protein LD125_00406 [Mesoplasma sp. JKS002658]|uniref:hypothetical protein n=1 Tax=Mesoplasma whartonense TaxID=2878854 RepID=UPI002022A3CF|nr:MULTISPECIES: hypothetical protein [unclassified Mesoplasma]MCL8211091.1 hypothetical protein [Mesoplasma sp. JKS002664]MCL8211752.1 hypothetical protein [Mesoplasma sp. JKS002662]MCL8214143.1 hypothetical protein [Mesoplasma sp. JKS002658]MCL8214429.1 hypothetical protein [Mesoplasma sp. JKS002663]MCL8215462.1 hypothetical protein [Mesoplasma sp. JKS002659]